MNIYEKATEKSEALKIATEKAIERTQEKVKTKTFLVLSKLQEIGAVNRITWQGWFTRIEIDLKEDTKSDYHKAMIRVMPDRIEYITGHYTCRSIGGCNEVKGDTILINNLSELENLIETDIINSAKFN
tara:strand:+ start:601 stop:987 length:387 start_codon:yes stop_codon:yes gene_type:complete